MKSKNVEDIVYQAVQSGELRIDPDGSIWRLAARRADRWTAGTRLIPCPPRRAESSTGSYLQVRVMFNGMRAHALAHRLVWRHFNGQIPVGLTINHKDGLKHNNCPTNLELATHAEQQRHMIKVLKKGRVLNQHGERNAMAKLTTAAVYSIKARRASGEKLKVIARDHGVSDRAISKISRGERWAFLGASSVASPTSPA